MEYYTLISKSELKKMKRFHFDGREGILYLSSDQKYLLKILKRFTLCGGIEGKKVLLDYLSRQSDLRFYAALPKELVNVPCQGTFGFFMDYIVNGVRLDEWLKNKSYEQQLEVFKKISKILKILHENYGIIVSDCCYHNILIVDDAFPIFVDVDSWSMDDIIGFTISDILYEYSKKQYWTRREQIRYLMYSKDADNAALWLMFLESVLKLPVRTTGFKIFRKYLEKREDVLPIIKEVTNLISTPVLREIPYFHEMAQQYTLRK